MKLVKKTISQCSAVVEPGEYTIDKWDNQRCFETKAWHMFKCSDCDNYYCITLHWPKHDCTGE